LPDDIAVVHRREARRRGLDHHLFATASVADRVEIREARRSPAQSLDCFILACAEVMTGSTNSLDRLCF
jgi:hypothetical protein